MIGDSHLFAIFFEDLMTTLSLPDEYPTSLFDLPQKFT